MNTGPIEPVFYGRNTMRPTWQSFAAEHKNAPEQCTRINPVHNHSPTAPRQATRKIVETQHWQGLQPMQ